jgi:nucleoside phosphorylase
MIVCAGNIESFEYAAPIGIGLIESAINLTQLCLKEKPKQLLFIGSAGSYSSDINIFDIFSSSSAANVENSFLEGHAYTPIDNMIKIEDTFLKDEVVVNCSNYITTNETFAKMYRNYNIQLENMEFYSVLSVAKKFNIPVGGIFVITNYCNAKAHDDFIANHAKSKELLTQYLYNHHYIEKVSCETK